jgi:hypothetical protein
MKGESKKVEEQKSLGSKEQSGGNPLDFLLLHIGEDKKS